MPYSTRNNKGIYIFFALAFAPFFFAHGQAPDTTGANTLQSDLNRLTESLDLLNSIKAGKRITDATPIQTALNDVLNISEEEIRSVTARLGAQANLTEEEAALQNELIMGLANLASHLKSVRADATQESGISAVISLAQKLKEWRDGPYTTTVERAVTFVSIFENENSIKAANARLASILKDEKKIRRILSGANTTTFARLIKKVQGGLRKAADLNTRAKAALMPDPNNATADDENSIDELIRQSGILVNDAYNDFIAMSKLIKK